VSPFISKIVGHSLELVVVTLSHVFSIQNNPRVFVQNVVGQRPEAVTVVDVEVFVHAREVLSVFEVARLFPRGRELVALHHVVGPLDDGVEFDFVHPVGLQRVEQVCIAVLLDQGQLLVLVDETRDQAAVEFVGQELVVMWFYHGQHHEHLLLGLVKHALTNLHEFVFVLYRVVADLEVVLRFGDLLEFVILFFEAEDGQALGHTPKTGSRQQFVDGIVHICMVQFRVFF